MCVNQTKSNVVHVQEMDCHKKKMKKYSPQNTQEPHTANNEWVFNIQYIRANKNPSQKQIWVLAWFNFALILLVRSLRVGRNLNVIISSSKM